MCCQRVHRQTSNQAANFHFGLTAQLVRIIAQKIIEATQEEGLIFGRVRVIFCDGSGLTGAGLEHNVLTYEILRTIDCDIRARKCGHSNRCFVNRSHMRALAGELECLDRVVFLAARCTFDREITNIESYDGNLKHGIGHI